MKLNKKAKLILIVIPIIILIVLMRFVWANNSSSENTRLVTRDRTSVILEQHQDDLKKVDVYLGMADDSSIASFQIGLNIDVSSNYDAKFEWADNFNNNSEEYKNVTVSQAKAPTTERDIERINIYYVGTEELNELSDEVDVDNVKVGTITLEGTSENENEDTSLMIRPIGTDKNDETTSDEEFTKTVSLAHVVSPVIVENDDILKTDLVKTEQEPDDPNTGDPNPGKPGEGEQNPDPDNPGTGTTDPENPDPENPDPDNPGTGTTDPENPDQDNPGTGTTDPENPGQDNPGTGTTDPENPGQDNPGTGTTDPENPGQDNPGIGTTNPEPPGQGNPRTGTQNPENPGKDNPGTGTQDPENPSQNGSSQGNNANTNTNTNLTDKGELDETPKTGIVNKMKYMIPFAIILPIAFVILRKKQTK